MKNSEDYSKLFEDFGKRVRELRKAQKVSTVEMSKRCFIDSGNYVRIEQGKTNPTLKTIQKICSALDISLAEFFSTL